MIEHSLSSAPTPIREKYNRQLSDFFDLNEIEQLQNAFATATGVSSVLRDARGQLIARSSNFPCLCEQFNRGSMLSESDCRLTGAPTAFIPSATPFVRVCRAGFLEANARIMAEDQPVATWVIGHVRDEKISDDLPASYAREIGAAKGVCRQCLANVAQMPLSKFRQISAALQLLANQLSKRALQKIEEVHLKNEHERLEAELRQAQKLESLGQLVGGVAHDFNNILTAQIMHLSLLHEREDLPTEVRESLTVLETGAHMAADLTRQLLAFSRRQVLQMQRIDLDRCVGNLIKMLRRMLGEDVVLRYEPSSVPPLLDADPGMIEQVIMNLVVNARDAMPQGGSLLIQTEVENVMASASDGKTESRAGRFVKMTVSDSGSGMDEATLQHMFEPFFTTKEAGKGTGLGLATVFGIIQQHKGWIEVDSCSGEGSTFRIFLPAAEAASLPGTALPEGGSPHAGHQDTIFIVEDEITVRQIIKTSLQQLGYRVIEATNGVEALALWPQYRDEVHLLVTDMVMPNGMNGLELAHRLRTERPDLPVIITSGYNAELARTRLPALDGVGFLAKPFKITQLAALIEQTLDAVKSPKTAGYP